MRKFEVIKKTVEEALVETTNLSSVAYNGELVTTSDAVAGYFGMTVTDVTKIALRNFSRLFDRDLAFILSAREVASGKFGKSAATTQIVFTRQGIVQLIYLLDKIKASSIATRDMKRIQEALYLPALAKDAKALADTPKLTKRVYSEVDVVVLDDLGPYFDSSFNPKKVFGLLSNASKFSIDGLNFEELMVDGADYIVLEKSEADTMKGYTAPDVGCVVLSQEGVLKVLAFYAQLEGESLDGIISFEKKKK